VKGYGVQGLRVNVRCFIKETFVAKQRQRLRVYGLGSRVHGSGSRVEGLWFWGLGFRIYGSGFRF
jgi:hypothetical protein